MYLKFFEIEEEFVCYDWIDNFKDYFDILRIFYMKIFFKCIVIG